jgi:protein-S-isoprenylcysteine O-methyltransferase Ste14
MMIAFKTLIFTVLVPGTVAVLIPYRLGSSVAATGNLPIGSFRYSGVGLIVAGALIYFWCAWDFTFAGRGTPAPIDPPKELVVRGLYKFVRNPMYVGVLSVLLGEAVLFEARVLFGYAGLLFVLFFAFVVLYEEPALGRKFGTSYQRYRDVVPRWIPRMRPLRSLVE